jgi:hypothetical protein
MYSLHLHIQSAGSKYLFPVKPLFCCLLLAGCLLCLSIDRENGRSTILGNVGELLPGYAASPPRRKICVTVFT